VTNEGFVNRMAGRFYVEGPYRRQHIIDHLDAIVPGAKQLDHLGRDIAIAGDDDMTGEPGRGHGGRVVEYLVALPTVGSAGE
jgi:hypothetical protein